MKWAKANWTPLHDWTFLWKLLHWVLLSICSSYSKHMKQVHLVISLWRQTDLVMLAVMQSLQVVLLVLLIQHVPYSWEKHCWEDFEICCGLQLLCNGRRKNTLSITNNSFTSINRKYISVKNYCRIFVQKHIFCTQCKVCVFRKNNQKLVSLYDSL